MVSAIPRATKRDMMGDNMPKLKNPKLKGIKQYTIPKDKKCNVWNCTNHAIWFFKNKITGKIEKTAYCGLHINDNQIQSLFKRHVMVKI